MPSLEQQIDEMNKREELMQTGYTCFEKKDFNGALAKFNALLALARESDDFITAYSMRGATYAEMNNNNMAFADWKKAADYGSEEALQTLKASGLNYTPQKPSLPSASTAPASTSQPPAGMENILSNAYRVGSAAAPAPAASNIGTLNYTDGGVYEGEIQNGKPHGKGKIGWPDGENYIGDFANGAQHGNGKYTWANGNTYEGGYAENLPHGSGTLVEKNGRIYIGGFLNGLRHGKGKMATPEGFIFEGEFFNDKLNGEGYVKYPDGNVEKGKWKDGELVSQSIFNFKLPKIF